MKKRWGVLFTLVILAFLIYLLKSVDLRQVLTLIKNLDPIYLILSVFCFFLALVFKTLRWKNSLSVLVKANFLFLLQVVFIGEFFNTVTPGTGIGGEPVKAYFMRTKYKKPKTKFFGTILSDKIIHFAVFILFVIFSILFLLVFINIPTDIKIFLEIILVLIFVGITLALFFVLRGTHLDVSTILDRLYKINFIKKRLSRRAGFKKYLNKRAGNIITVLKKLFHNKKIISKSILFTLMLWFSIYLSSYLLFLAFNSQINFLSVLIVVTLGYLIGDISPVPGGIGLVESTTFLLYSAMGVSPPLAMAVALLSRIISYFHTLLVGGLMLIYLKFRLK